MKEGIQRAGTQFAYQGNMDSGVLFGSQETITQLVRQNAKEAREMGVRHVLNLGHGIMQVGGWVGAARGEGGTVACICCCASQHRPAKESTPSCPASRPHRSCIVPSACPCCAVQGTPEENVEHFFKVAKEIRYADL